MVNTRVRQLEPNPLMIEIERMQQAGYSERRINAAVAAATRSYRSSWSTRLRERFGRGAAVGAEGRC